MIGARRPKEERGGKIPAGGGAMHVNRRGAATSGGKGKGERRQVEGERKFS